MFNISVWSPWSLCQEFPYPMSYFRARHQQLVQQAEKRTSPTSSAAAPPSSCPSPSSKLHGTFSQQTVPGPSAFGNPDQRGARGMDLLQTDSVGETGMMIVWMLLASAHSAFSPSTDVHLVQHPTYNRFCLLVHLRSLWLPIMGCFPNSVAV